jgi:hypothetical protein
MAFEGYMQQAKRQRYGFFGIAAGETGLVFDNFILDVSAVLHHSVRLPGCLASNCMRCCRVAFGVQGFAPIRGCMGG